MHAYLFHRLMGMAALVTITASAQVPAHLDHSNTDDHAVIAVVLEDFANWKEATFGNLEGRLELASVSKAGSAATAASVATLVPKMPLKVDEELAAAFNERNKVAVPISAIVADLPWAVISTPHAKDEPYRRAPNIKATGSLSMAGFNSDGSKALIQIYHSWSMHGAMITYVLSRVDGRWQIVARDQDVYL